MDANIFTFYVVVCTDATSEDTPGRFIEDRVAHPLSVNVVDQLLKLLCISPLVEMLKRRMNAVLWQER